MTLTARQYVVMYLYYRRGCTHRQIASALSIKHTAVQKLLVRGNRWVLEEAVTPEGVATSDLVRGLLQPSLTASVTGHVGRAASRQEELLDRLELRMQQRARELADIEECMSCGSDLPTRRSGAALGGVNIGPNGTRWPAEKWTEPITGRVVVLPQDE